MYVYVCVCVCMCMRGGGVVIILNYVPILKQIEQNDDQRRLSGILTYKCVFMRVFVLDSWFAFQGVSVIFVLFLFKCVCVLVCVRCFLKLLNWLKTDFIPILNTLVYNFLYCCLFLSMAHRCECA